MQSLSVRSSSPGGATELMRYGPTKAIGTEPSTSHRARRMWGEPSRLCTRAPPVL